MSLSFLQHLEGTAEAGSVQMIHVDLTVTLAQHRLNGGNVTV